MEKFQKLFNLTKSVIIGMVHVRALPGCPRNIHSVDEIIEIACKEAQIYQKCGINGILIENMYDVPFQLPKNLGPEVTAMMTAVCCNIRRECPDLPLGVQILAAANIEAMAVAKATGLNFVRVEGFNYSHIADEGPIHACASELLRYRKNIDANDVQIFTDIKKKHCSHAVTSDISLRETARTAQMFLSDGVIVTGKATGRAARKEDLEDVQKVASVPVIIGSGVTENNLEHYISANAIIIGSSFKKSGHWDGDIDRLKVDAIMKKTRRLRRKLKEDDEKNANLQNEGFIQGFV